MKRIEELEYPVRDKTKNYILQLEQRGIEKGIEKGVINLLKKGFEMDLICEVMEVTL